MTRTAATGAHKRGKRDATLSSRAKFRNSEDGRNIGAGVYHRGGKITDKVPGASVRWRNFSGLLWPTSVDAAVRSFAQWDAIIAFLRYSRRVLRQSEASATLLRGKARSSAARVIKLTKRPASAAAVMPQ